MNNTCVILIHPWSLENINIESYFFGIKKNKFYNLHIKKLIIPFLNSINNLIPIIISLPSGFLPHSSVGEITHEIFYDEMGYRKLKKSLKLRGISNVLLMGYSLDECVISTSAGYLNLKKDFNTFLFSDMTLSNFHSKKIQ